MIARPEDPAVVVAGDALVDMTPTTTVRGHLAYEPHPGGSSLNIAVGPARLGVPTAFPARLSRDAFGDLLRAHLAASGVQPSYLIETDDLTTVAAVHLRDGSGDVLLPCRRCGRSRIAAGAFGHPAAPWSGSARWVDCPRPRAGSPPHSMGCCGGSPGAES
jgi:pfkB family carbohydrate kinase